MTISLPIRSPRNDEKSGERKQWWENFTRATREEKFGDSLDFKAVDWLHHRKMELSKYNAEYYGAHVHFTTEQDATFFILRWS
jgi:hypothetical protein